MLSYQTGIPVQPPISDATRRNALAALVSAPTAWGNTNAADVFAGMGQQNAVNYDRDAASANADFVAKARDLQNQMGVRGLQQMQQQYSQNDNVALQRQQAAAGRMSDYLSGVNGLLRGLFT